MVGLIERLKAAVTSRTELQRRVDVLADKVKRAAARVDEAKAEHARIAELVVDGADSDMPKVTAAREAIERAEQIRVDMVALLEAAETRLGTFTAMEEAARIGAQDAKVRAAAGDIVASIADFEAAVSRLQALIRRVETDCETFREIGGARVQAYPRLGGLSDLRERLLRYLDRQIALVWTDPANMLAEIEYKTPGGLSRHERQVLDELLGPPGPVSPALASDDPPEAA